MFNVFLLKMLVSGPVYCAVRAGSLIVRPHQFSYIS